MRRKLILTVAGWHVIVVLMGATHCLPLPSATPAASLLNVYAACSGAEQRFGYFAPAVAAEWRPRIEIYSARTAQWACVKPADEEGEFGWRVSTARGALANRATRELIAAAWAARVFTEVADATYVLVKVEVEDLPSLHEVGNGAPQPTWVLVDVLAFERK
jgi:hypothetical protein